MDWSKIGRIPLGVKAFIITFPGGLLLQALMGFKEINFLRSFFIVLGYSIGVSFVGSFIKHKKSSNELTENKNNINRAYLSLFLGATSIPGFPFLILSILGIFYAIPGLKSSKKKIAILGIVLSCIGLFFAVIVYGSILYNQIIRKC